MAGSGWNDPSGGFSAAIMDQQRLAQIPVLRAQLPLALAQAQLAQMGVAEKQQEQQAYADIAQQLKAGGAGAGAPGAGGGAASAGQTLLSGGLPEATRKQIMAAEVLADHGLFKKSGALMKDAMAQVQSIQSANSAAARERLTELKTAHEVASNVNSLTVGVRDQASFDRAKVMFLANNPGEQPPPWFYLPYEQARPYINQVKQSSKEGMEATKTFAEIDQKRQATLSAMASQRLTDTKARIEARKEAYIAEREALARKNGQAIPDPRAVDKPGKAGDPLGEKIDSPYYDPTVDARTSYMATRVTSAAREAHRTIEMIEGLGDKGVLSPFAELLHTKDKSLIDPLRKYAMRSMSKDEHHQYAAMLAGLNIAAATVLRGGFAPPVSQAQAEDEALKATKGMSRYAAVSRLQIAALKLREELKTQRGKSGYQAKLIEDTIKDFDRQVEYLGAVLKKLKPDAKVPGIDESPEQEYARKKAGLQAQALDKLPEGATLYKTLPDGRKVYQTPDGGKFVEEP